MMRQWKKSYVIFVLWGVLLLLFAVFMADRYCRMLYGGGIFYVAAGQNEITEEEIEYLHERDFGLWRDSGFFSCTDL